MIDKMERHWRTAAISLVVIFTIGMVALIGSNVRLYNQNSRQDLELAAYRAQLQAANDLRKSEAKAAIERAKIACALSKKGVETANGIVGNMRKSLLDISVVVTNPDVKKTLIADAALFPDFPMPTCDDGKKKSTP